MLGEAGLGFRRLSVIDLESSHQPMSNEEGTVWLLFNGEIYNFKDLRRSLQDRGHRFKTSGDGETILHLYEDHGLDFVHHLNGMFAVALWDTQRRRLVMARDRMGIKPLYYFHDGARIAFASETKALLQVPWVSRDLDLHSLAAYMNFASIPEPGTCFAGIRRLPPGHLAVFDAGGLLLREYWDVRFDRQKRWKWEDLVDATDELLRDAVRIRLVSDVPLGVFLSGGVDSSLVASIMTEVGSGPTKAYSIGFGREGAYMDEMEYARTVADKHGMIHRCLIFEWKDLLREIERITWFLDEPCGDPAAFLTLALSEFTRSEVTVALSGLGGDELFGGYRRYLAVKYHSKYLRVPAAVRRHLINPILRSLPEGRTSRLANLARLAKKFALNVDGDIRTSWAATTSYLPPYAGPLFQGDLGGARRNTYRNETFERYWSRVAHLGDPLDQVMYMDMKMYLPDQLLHLQDRMSMAVSLEARVPFMDHRLVELAASVPSELKIRGRSLKIVLKHLAERYVPRHCIYREKKGFTAPLEVWLRGHLRDPLEDALSPRRVRDRGFFKVDFVEWMKREFFDRGRDLALPLYQALLLEVWMRKFVDSTAAP